MYLISDSDGVCLRWSDSDDRRPDESAMLACDDCVAAGVSPEETGPAECNLDERPGDLLCVSCRDAAILARVARECAHDAGTRGVRGPLEPGEDAGPEDYVYLQGELCRPATRIERGAFRDAYSAALRRPAAIRSPEDECGCPHIGSWHEHEEGE